MNMEIIVSLHSILRWIILILSILVLVRAYSGWLGKRHWTGSDRKVGVFFGIALDIQLLLGIILWLFGSWGLKAFDLPVTEGASRMTILYFAMEHSVAMVLAVVLVHIGSSRVKKAQQNVDKHKMAAIFYSVAIVLIIISIPWVQRPLFPVL